MRIVTKVKQLLRNKMIKVIKTFFSYRWKLIRKKTESILGKQLKRTFKNKLIVINHCFAMETCLLAVKHLPVWKVDWWSTILRIYSRGFFSKRNGFYKEVFFDFILLNFSRLMSTKRSYMLKQTCNSPARN